MNAWNFTKEDTTPYPDTERCAERLAGERCLLAHGHEGNHLAPEPKAPSHDQEDET